MPQSPVIPLGGCALACLLGALALSGPSANAAADYEAGFDARAGHLLDFVHGGWTPPFPNFSNVHMHYWASALATIATTPEGILHPQVNDGDGESSRPPRYWGILKYDGESASGDNTVPANRGGSNTSFSWNSNIFHFIFPGLANLMGLHPDIPAWDDPHHRDPTLTYRENYLRYVLTRTDNYNAFTGEGTENHINMSRPSAWVLVSEAARLGIGDFPGQPFTAAERAQQMRDWMLGWSQRIYEVGIGEWDSGTYHMVSIKGWLTAYDYAYTAHGWDPGVQAAARAVLDFYAATLAIKHVNYHIAGAESRSGRNFTRMNNGTAYLAYLWFADTEAPPPEWRGNNPGEAVFAAVSSYRPPLQIVNLARRSTAAGETYHALKPSYILQEGGQSVEVVHIGHGFTLGSANMNIGSFHASTWQIVPWKLMVNGASWNNYPSATVIGNGGFYGAGILNTRDPWMQTVQHKNVLIQMHRVPTDASSIVSAVQTKYNEWKASWYDDFTARWPSPDWGGFNGDTFAGRRIPLNFQASGGNVNNARTGHIVYPSGSTQQLESGVRFIQLGTVYLAVRSIRGAQPGLTSNRVTDTGAAGQLFGLVMEVGTQSEHGTFAQFRAAILADTSLDLSARDTHNRVTYTTLAGETIAATYQTSGTWIEPDYDWNYGVTTPGGEALFHTGTWRQPEWPSGEGHGRQPTWTVNGSPVDPASWPLIDGPRLRLDEARLEVLGDSEILYAIDYSGAEPAFFIALEPASISADAALWEIRVPTKSGLRYQWETSSDLQNWTPLGPAFAGNGGEATETVPASPGPQFFRVRVSP